MKGENNVSSNYKQITDDNIIEYGQGTRHLELLSNRYTNRTHFIFEILQNAEDANASRILFKLFGDSLEVKHNGRLFNETDVRGICGVGEGVKAADLTKIGKFGIGFKSVYVYTKSPEVHSGDENFRIDHYVRPRAIPPRNIEDPWTTLFVLSFDQENITPETAAKEIGKRLRELGARTILFLRNIETIEYQLPKEQGVYNRSVLDTQEAMRKVAINFGNKKREYWVIFERKVLTPDSSDKVCVEIAYNLETNSADETLQITRAGESPLYVYFPTERDTRLGFLMQGPYRTTLARDNIPSDDEWNQKLISETAELVTTSLGHLKNMDLLTISLLETLPIRESDFTGDSLFFPIFKRVSQALESDAFLPTNDNSYVSVKNAVLSDSEGIVRLLNSNQLSSLFEVPHLIKWVSSDISERRTPDLWRYLRSEHSIPEIDPEMFARRLSKSFLSERSDEWLIEFYRFLSTGARPPLSIWKYPGSILRMKPIIRLQDGRHVMPFNDKSTSNVYLPLDAEINLSFPIVKLEIAQNEDAYEFLKALGVQEYDIVAEVIETILPKYKEDSPIISLDEHRRDFARIKRAYDTDSQEKKTQLRNALQDTPFILAEKPDLEANNYFKPDQLYFDNSNLRLYFEGNSSYAFVNLNDYPSSAQKLFADLGVTDSVRVERKEKNQQGYVPIYRYHGNHKRGLDGFDPHIEVDGLEHALNHLTPEKSVFIWNQITIPNADCIVGTVEKSSKQTYENSSFEKDIVSESFGKLLIDTKWLPDADGNMRKPNEISLDELPELFKEDEQLRKKLNMPMSKTQIIDIISPTIKVSSDILNGIMDASPEQIAKIETILQTPSEYKFRHISTSEDIPFPIKPVSNPERFVKFLIDKLQHAPDQKYEKKYRNVRTSRGSIDPKTWLTEQYRNDNGQVVCQICQEEMPFKYRSGIYYFDAVEMLKGYFTKEYEAQFLALCPECSPKYKTFVKQVPDAMNTLKNQLIEADNSGNFEVSVKLGDWDTSIRFVERHWRNIKTILRYYAQQSKPIPESSSLEIVEKKLMTSQTTKSSQPGSKESGNWNADKILKEKSLQPIRFVTYSGDKDLSNIEIGKYKIEGIDDYYKKNILAKSNILFAFSKENTDALKPAVIMRESVKNQHLLPVENFKNPFQVDDKLLTQAKMDNSIVTVVTRAGNVIRGLIQCFDKSVLYMLVGEKDVIIYRHGLYEFSIEE